MSWLYSTCFKIAWLICGSWLKRANCPSRLMATIYFLGPSPRHDSRFYLIACVHFAICVFCSVVPFPQKRIFWGPLYIWLFDENIKKELVSNEFIRLMATIYFLGSSPRHDSRIYLIARINSQFSSITRSFLFPTKLNFVRTPLHLNI